VGQRATADVERNFLVPEMSSLDDADRDTQHRDLPGCNSFGPSPIRDLAGDAGDNGENMENHCEPHETDDLWDVRSYEEMEYRLKSLRSLVCDLLRTNQELRHALLDAGIDTHGGEEAQLRPTPRPSI
jgi:hypothetical protein